MQSPLSIVRRINSMMHSLSSPRKGRLLLLLLLVLFSTAPVSAHFYYARNFPFAGTAPDLTALLSNDTGKPAFWSVKDKAYFISFKKQLEAEGHPENDFRFQADRAFCNYILGDTLALATLEDLYARHPEESNLAANLSLIYERRGNHARALELARKAFELFPGAWFGSGKLRLRLLEREENALQFNGAVPFNEWLNNPKAAIPGNADTLMLQLAWQLHLRTALFSVPDTLTARLLIAFGDMVAKTNTRSTAKPFYEAALAYAPEKKALLAERLLLMDASEKEVKKTFRWAALVWGVPILALLVAFAGNFINRRKKQQGINP